MPPVEGAPFWGTGESSAFGKASPNPYLLGALVFKQLMKVVLFLALSTAAFAQGAPCSNGSNICTTSGSTSTSATALTLATNGGVVPSFTYTWSGSPTGVSTVLQGCIGNPAVCTTIDTYSSATSTTRSNGNFSVGVVTAAYDFFKVTSTFTGASTFTVIEKNNNTASNTSGGVSGSGTAGKIAAFTGLNSLGNLSTPSLCTGGQFATGIDTTGAAQCGTPAGGGNVSTTGSPATGNLTTFTSPTTVSNGDLSGDCTTSGALLLNCTKTNGNLFVASATTDTTNAANIGSGTLNTLRLPSIIDIATGFRIGGSAASGNYLRGNGTNFISGAIQAADVPTLNQNTTGTASNVSGTPALPNGTTATKQAAGTNNGTLATMSALYDAVAGVNPAVAVQAATTQASDTSGLAYNNGVAGIGATFTGATNTAITVDGYTFTAVGQRLLVKNDTQSPSGAFNGMYYVTQVQGVALPLILTRALDYDQSSDINNTGAIPVINGTANAATSWLLASSVTTVGTDPLTYTRFSYNPASIVLNNASNTYSTGDQDLHSATSIELASTRAGAKTTSTVDQGGQDGTSADAITFGGKTIRGGDVADAGGSLGNTAGAVVIRGGDNASVETGGIQKGGPLTIRGGATTDGASNGDTVPGYVDLDLTFRKGATYTGGDSPTGGLLGAFTGHNTIQDLGQATTDYQMVGLERAALQTTGALVEVLGSGATYKVFASSNVTNGDVLCSDQTHRGYVLDNGSSPCSCPSQQVGLVELTNTGVTTVVGTVQPRGCVPTIAATSNQWVNTISLTTGAASTTQPACGSLSDGSDGCKSSVPTSAKLAGTDGSKNFVAAALNSAHVYVGNGSNLPVDVAVSQDISLANTGAATVTGVNAAAVPASASCGATNSSGQIVGKCVQNRTTWTATAGTGVIGSPVSLLSSGLTTGFYHIHWHLSEATGGNCTTAAGTFKIVYSYNDADSGQNPAIGVSAFYAWTGNLAGTGTYSISEVLTQPSPATSSVWSGDSNIYATTGTALQYQINQATAASGGTCNTFATAIMTTEVMGPLLN